MATKVVESAKPPNPSFILQNSKQVTFLLFANGNKSGSILYTGNREGDLIVYNYKLRRPVFSSFDSNKQSILTIAEIDENAFFTHTRNGRIFKWAGLENSNFHSKCTILFTYRKLSIEFIGFEKFH